MEIYRQLPRTASTVAQMPEDVRREVLTWLAAMPGKWLLVFDGADQLDKSDNDSVDLSQYMLRGRTTHVIVTSRIAAVEKLSTFEGVQVGELEKRQAAMLFCNCSGLEQIDEKTKVQVDELTHELGFLALAITIAGTYVSQTPRLLFDLTKYLEEYRRRRHALLAKQPDGLVDKYRHSVMTVWETSYSAVEEQLPQACRLLTLLTFINYEDIYLELFGLDSVSEAMPAKKPWMSIWNDGQLDYDNFCVVRADNRGVLYIGSDTAFPCGDASNGATPRDAEPVGDYWFKRNDGPSCSSIEMVAGYFYPLRLVWGNWGTPSSLNVTVTPPGGNATTNVSGMVSGDDCG